MKILRIEGDPVPALGLGTWMLEGEQARRAVEHALSLGYRHVDTAQAYGNEEEVGRGLAASRVPRADVFLTTKIWWENLSADRVIATTEQSLRRLGTEYVDLLLIHWPAGEAPLDEPLTTMTTLREAGKARHIGVSNFTPSLLEDSLTKAPVVCNQVEYHPFLGQDELLGLAEEHGLVLTAYSPLARGEVTKSGTLREIGRTQGKSPTQVTLRWLLDQDPVAAIPKAASPKHREANIDIFDFELSDEEREAIDALDQGRRMVDPEFAPAWESRGGSS